MLYVSDVRVKADFLENLQRVYKSPKRSAHDRMKLSIRRVTKDEILTSSAALFDRFEQTLNAPASSKLFIALEAPSRCSKTI